MAKSKKVNFNTIFSLNSVFILLFLVLFPFGQLIRVGIFQPIDIVVGLASLYSIIAKYKEPPLFKHFKNFIFIASISWFFSLFIFNQATVFYGLLYLIRLFVYVYFLIYVWNFAKEKSNQELLVTSLLTVSVVSALFGWVQFLVFPDIKPLFIWGWDTHLFRLVGTFFDPGYLGLIIVFGLLISILRFLKTKNNYYILFTLFLLVSLAFTYSRASYLAFIAGLISIAVQIKGFKQLVLPILFLLALVPLLPTARNHSIELFRSQSIVARITNYKTTLQIFEKSPVFGVGYNNLCVAYQKYIGYQKFSSHACSGSDSSILFVLSTTGVLGLMVFIFLIAKIKSNLVHSDFYTLLTSSFAALIVHSLFANSMFYPWVMGWILILVVLAL